MEETYDSGTQVKIAYLIYGRSHDLTGCIVQRRDTNFGCVSNGVSAEMKLGFLLLEEEV